MKVNTHKFFGMGFKLFIFFVMLLPSAMIGATSVINALRSIDYVFKGEGHSEIILKFAKRPELPQHFSIDSPPSIIFDFANVALQLPDKEHDINPHLEFIEAISFIEDKTRTRMMVDVMEVAPVDIRIFDTTMRIAFKHQVTSGQKGKAKALPAHAKASYINAIDFEKEDGQIGKISLSGDLKRASIDLQQAENKIILKLPNTRIADNLMKTFDVHHLATNIERVTVEKHTADILFVIETQGEYLTSSYHLGERLVFETRPEHVRRGTQQKSQHIQITPQYVSFNFQDIEVRSALQILAELTDMNLIVGDSVKGNMTLRLDYVPWDKALDVILKSNQLSQKQMGNVLLVLSTEEMIAKEQADHMARSKLDALAPLVSKKIVVQYTSAAHLAEKISGQPQLLSSRGSVQFDERTNTLFVKDTENNLDEIVSMIEAIDIPVRQVMIESQIVETDQTLSEMLGLKFAAQSLKGEGHGQKKQGLFYDNATPPLHMTGRPGTLSLAVANLPAGTLLDLELQALEQESKGKILARPKLLTLDKKAATIESGTEIPFATQSEGGTHTQFKKAVLSLSATPQITPNEKIILQLDIHKDAPSSLNNPQAGPGIDTTTISTTVLVENGQTIVLGGMYHQDEKHNDTRVPFLAALPVVGNLFQNHEVSQSKKELLFFITPKIINPNA